MKDLEKQILNSVEKSIGEAIRSELVGYNKPLSELCSEVISSHRSELFDLLDGEVATLIGGKEFRSILKEELNRKLAKTLVGKLGGELEKQLNALKQNPSTRAKITLAIEQVTKELLSD